MISMFLYALTASLIAYNMSEPLWLLVAPVLLIFNFIDRHNSNGRTEKKVVDTFMEAGNYDNLPKRYKELAKPWVKDRGNTDG